ncbi:MAG: hypothetical protein Q8O33_18630 [Pseudomonadota bacterium]|nr:hypothetical protein [Pseudomonadota bacterium]
MAAFNYRRLIHQVPGRSWQYYFQSRAIALPHGHDWGVPADKLTKSLIAITESLDASLTRMVLGELRQVHAFANRRGIDAIRNVAKPDAALHDDFTKLSCDAERALWTMANWPELFKAAAAILDANLRTGIRGWKRFKFPPCDVLFRSAEDIRALELAVGEAFTPRKGRPRACEIEPVDRHLDGGVQLALLIEDNVQRQLEFGDDDRARWRDIRPPMKMDAVIYPATGVMDILASGGEKTLKKLLPLLGKHIFQKPLQVEDIDTPMFFLNRLRDGFELFDDSQIDLAAHGVEKIRLSQARLHANLPPHCDYIIKPPGQKNAPDVLDCVKAQRLDHVLMSQGFNILEAVVSLYFLPRDGDKSGRVLHIEIKQAGISNLRDMDEADAQLVEALLQAWGVMQTPASSAGTPASTDLSLEMPA